MAIAANGLTPLLQVFDMPASLAFYRGKLGFELVSASEEVDSPEGRFSHWCWLRLGPADLMLNTAYDEDERPPAPDPARVAAHNDTCLYFGCEDCDAVHAELVASGLSVDPPKVAPYGMKQLCLRDPDGFGLCFQHPV